MNYVEKFAPSHFSADAAVASGVDVHSKGDIASHASSGHGIIVPDAHLLFTGDFKRAGSDLVLSKDGHDHVVHDYFKGHARATLSSPDGAQLSGSLVEALTGEVQVAQAGGGGGGATVIGHVTKLTGSATAIRNGVSVMLNAGDNVNKGDVVQAGPDSSLGLTFIDGTVFGLSSNARMVLNEMVYDPNGSSNSSLLSLVQGTITFVAGETAKHGDMKVDTPVATMGIRGTAVLVEIDFSVPGQGGAPPVKFQVLVEPGGHTGSYVLYSKTGAIIGTVNQSGQVTLVDGAGDTTTTTAPPLSQTAQDIITYTMQQYFPNYVPNANPKGSGSGSGSTPPFSNPDPLKLYQPPDMLPGVPFIVPINLPDGQGGSTHVDVTVTRFNSTPTVTVTPVVVTFPVNKTSFDIGDQVHITDPDTTDTAVPYVAGTARILSAVGPANTPATIDLTQLITLDPQTGHITYNPAAFKFLPAGTTAVYTIGFDSQSGPDTLHETLTFTVDGVNDAPVVSGPLTAAAQQSDAVQNINLLAGASDPDLGGTPALAVANVSYSVNGGPASTSVSGLVLIGAVLHVDPAAFAYLAQGDSAVIVVSYNIVDPEGAIVAQTETITITGTNDDPVIVVAGTDATEIVDSIDPAGVTAQGVIAFADVDATDTHTASVSGGALGGLVLTVDPVDPTKFNWSYSADPASVEAALLNSSTGIIQETFTVTISDNHGGTVDQTVTVTLEANVWQGPGAIGTFALAEADIEATTNWSDPANWSFGAPPDSSQIVLINFYTNINLDVDATVGALLISDSVSIELSATDGARTLTVAGDFVNEGYVKLDPGVSLEVSGAIHNSGTLEIDDTSTPAGAALVIDGTVTLDGGGWVTLAGFADRIESGASDTKQANAKLINVDNHINGYGTLGDGHLDITNQCDGRIVADTGYKLVVDVRFADFINYGTIESAACGGLEIRGDLVNHGTLDAFGGLLDIDGDLTGHGLAVINGGTLEFGGRSDANVQFSGCSSDELILDRGSHFTGTVSGLSFGDSIDLQGISPWQLQILKCNGAVEVHYGCGPNDFFTITDPSVYNHLDVQSDHHGGTELVWENDAPELDTSSVHLSKNSGGSFKISGVSAWDDDSSPGETYTLDIDGHQVKCGSLSSIDDYLERGFSVTPTSPQATVAVAITDGFGATDKMNFIFNTAPLQSNTQVTLTGTNDKDIIFATGNTDTLTGGGGADQFVFGPHSGAADKDVITDFQVGVDKIELDHIRGVPSLSGPFAELSLAVWELTGGIEQKGNDTLIHLDGGDTLRLNNVHMASLHASDFIVHPYASGHA